MLFVVLKETMEIKFRVDAWVSDCIDQAARFVAENNLTFLDQEITFNGDMVIWVA